MSAPEIPPHESPIRTPKQLVITVALAFIVPIIMIIMLATLVTSGRRPGPDSPAMSPEQVAARIKPVAQLDLGGAGGGAGQALKSGEAVYKSVCVACHAAGVSGAPKFGNRADWAPRIKTGESTLFQVALKGKGAMPPKGGASDLSETEVQRAVVYMANAAGAKFREPAAPASAAPPAHGAHEEHAAAPAPTAAAATSKASGAVSANGKKTFDTTCVVCHGTGVAGAPKFGDKAAWAPHLAHGVDALYESALHGKNAMPPKGGNATLSDADVRAAVNYMVSAVK